MMVALRKESVDRKSGFLVSSSNGAVSLSARRAWIEKLESKQIDPSVMSLSARRAWIENLQPAYHVPPYIRRSPQGERG